MKKYLFILALSLLAQQILWAQSEPFWEEAPGPYGGLIGVTQTQTSVTYASHYKGGLYRSEDFGVHWEKFNVSKVDASSYQEDLRIGFSGTFYKIVSYLSGSSLTRKLYRSANEGASWVLVNDNMQVSALEEAPSGVLIGLGPWESLYRSADGGASWQFIYTPGFPVSYYSFGLSFMPNGIMMLWDGGVSSYFAVSADNGLSWTEGAAPGVFATPKLVSNGTVFAIPDFGEPDLYRSTDNGITWQTTSFSLSNNENLSSVIDLNNGRLLLSTSRRMFFSDNNGVDWTQMPASPEAGQEFALDFPMANGDIIGRRDGLYRSSDGGATWSMSSYGINQADTRQLALLTDSLQLAVSYSGLWRTDDAGENWTRLLIDTSDTNYYSHYPLAVLNADTFAVIMANKMWLSTDSGQSYGNITPNGGLSWRNIFKTSGKKLFGSGAGGVVRSDNLGGNWTTIIPNVAINTLVEHPSGDLFAYTTPLNVDYPKTLWRSTNEGITWIPVTTLTFSPDQRRALHADNNGKIYATGFHDNAMRLAISADKGATWEYKIIPDIYAFDDFIAVNDIGRIFLSAGNDVKIMTSADGGDSWYYLPEYSDHTSLLNGLELSPSGILYIVPSSATLYRSTASTEQGAYITGHVRRDADMECSTPDAQEPLKNWVVELEGEQNLYASTNADGRYTFFVDTGNYELHAVTPQTLWWSICDSVQTVQSDSLFQIDTVDFAAIALSECPLMTVDVAIPALHRCFDNEVYVQYCNQGSETADSAWVEVTLDPYLSLVNTAQPYYTSGNNVYHFLIGDVASGDCGNFSLSVHVDCDSAVLGQTHCVLAHAFPDTLCAVVQNWSGATIQGEVTCQDTVVQLRLRNTGYAPSHILSYIIIEDDVALFQGQQQYDTNQAITLNYPANGHTWRVESQQEPGHPFSNTAVAFSEGCGGFETLGFINQFEVNTFQPSYNQVCVENTGSYDPNDKQGFPTGYGDEHRIRPGQELEYMIRFQNTGTAPAYNIVIRDTLPVWLAPASVRPGAASHPYTWALSGQGVISFNFNNIQLPDSNTNLAASQGFVSFRVGQQTDVPLGTKIYNSAAIYFDFNEPVITNQTLHTVGIDYLTGTSAPPAPATGHEVLVSPNPVPESTVFRLKHGNFQQHRLLVTDALGRKMREAKLDGKEYVFQRRSLPPGTYFYRVEDASGRLTDSGTLLLR
ncbi:MAG: DUF11 domain-containing protein [Saprospiraceae bacterium]|nr:DUF11 domain-containing protein [Saprospiraceae bacterium]